MQLFTQCLRNGRWWVFEYVVSYAEHIVLYIFVPHYLGDVYGKRSSVDKRNIFIKLLDILADKVPLMECEKFAGSSSHFETSINFQYPKYADSDLNFDDVQPVSRSTISNTNAGTKWKSISHNLCTIRLVRNEKPGYHCKYLDGAVSEWYWHRLPSSSQRSGFKAPDVQFTFIPILGLTIAAGMSSACSATTHSAMALVIVYVFGCLPCIRRPISRKSSSDIFWQQLITNPGSAGGLYTDSWIVTLSAFETDIAGTASCPLNMRRKQPNSNVHTFNFGIDRHRSTTRCVPNVLSVTAVRRVSLNLTVAAEWKTIVTSEHSLCLSSALRPRSGSDTSPLMHTTFSNTFSASSVDRMRSNTCARKITRPICSRMMNVLTVDMLSSLRL
ncbi:hypothetical protein AGLY_003513, partial [Aphis glycines]